MSDKTFLGCWITTDGVYRLYGSKSPAPEWFLDTVERIEPEHDAPPVTLADMRKMRMHELLARSARRMGLA